MARKARRQRVAQGTKAAQPARQGQFLASRKGAPKPKLLDEMQYVHVRQDLIRIGLLALALFGGLVLLWVFFSVL